MLDFVGNSARGGHGTNVLGQNRQNEEGRSLARPALVWFVTLGLVALGQRGVELEVGLLEELAALAVDTEDGHAAGPHGMGVVVLLAVGERGDGRLQPAGAMAAH